MLAKVTFSYDGSKFQGSQQQKWHKNTVLNEFLFTCKRLGIDSKIHASGRTDRGVHATNQVVHFDLPLFWLDLKKLKTSLNRYLHPFIHVTKIELKDDNFHSRFSAIKRQYRYIISHKNHDPFLASYRYFYPRFDIEKLNEILQLFVGIHDFGYFKKKGSETKTDIREIYEIKTYMYKGESVISLKGNSFLRSQVRMIVAAALSVMEGTISKKELQEQIDLKHQHVTNLAPASGLYLTRIYY